MKVVVVPIIIRVLGLFAKSVEKKLKELEIKRKNWNHPDHRTVKIGQSTQKSSGDTRRFASQTPVKVHQLTLVWKNLQGVGWLGFMAYQPL